MGVCSGGKGCVGEEEGCGSEEERGCAAAWMGNGRWAGLACEIDQFWEGLQWVCEWGRFVGGFCVLAQGAWCVVFGVCITPCF